MKSRLDMQKIVKLSTLNVKFLGADVETHIEILHEYGHKESWIIECHQ
ncbi:hypothetical protein [Holospora obtusa]|nr:hypothetical protein [Holospora obtusa]